VILERPFFVTGVPGALGVRIGTPVFVKSLHMFEGAKTAIAPISLRGDS